MTRDAKKQSVTTEHKHQWARIDCGIDRPEISCECGVFPKSGELPRIEAILRLREWIKPGDTLHTQLKHVSRSGMMRVIQVVKISCPDKYAIDEGRTEPEISYLGYNIALALDWKYDREREGIRVGGCGMDMGFHIIHTLGYVLYGEQAKEGTDAESIELRKALLAADKFYFTQGGSPAPDPNKPGREWFGGAGYALKHKWL